MNDKKKILIGYNCKVCHGRNFIGDPITLHACAGFAEPVYEEK